MGGIELVTVVDEVPAALSIGIVLGGSDALSLSWRRVITGLGKRVIERRAGVISPLRLNVVFHLDGATAPNEFTGVRTGRFNRKDAQLLVQVALDPRDPVVDRDETVMRLLLRAVDEAESFARHRGVADELGEIRALLHELPAGA